MHRLSWLTILSLLVLGQAYAQNNRLIISFGGAPGDSVPHSYDYGAPPDAGETYTLRIPTRDPVVKEVFYDTALSVRTDDKVVQSVTAARAYVARTRCTEARDSLAEKFEAALDREYAGSDERWQRQSADGKVLGRLQCDQDRHDPLPVLHLEIIARP